MTAHEYLKQIANIKWLISSYTRQIEVIEQEADYDYQLTGIAYDRDKIMVSASNSQYSPSERRADLIMKRTRQRAKLIEERDTIIDMIHGINKQPHMEILERYYVYGETLIYISNDINMSYDRTRHIHSEALNIFADLYDLEKSTHNSTDIGYNIC